MYTHLSPIEEARELPVMKDHDWEFSTLIWNFLEAIDREKMR